MSKGTMTVADAGRKGGTVTRERYGEEHYARIGAKGGERVKALLKEGVRQEQVERADEAAG